MTDILEAPEAEVAPARRRRSLGRARWLAWVLVLGLAGALLGFAIGTRLEARAKADVSVALTPLPGNAFSSTSGGVLVDLETESHLPRSDAVLRRVASDGLGPSTPGIEVLRRRLTVSVVPNTQVIVIHYVATDPQVALQMGRRIARATLAERVGRATAVNAQRAEIVQERIDAIRIEVDDLADQLDSDPTSDRLRQQIRLLSLESVALEAQYRSATAAVASPGEIIASSTHNDVLLKRLRQIVLVGCLAAGMLLGAWVGRAPRREDPATGRAEAPAPTT